MKLPNGFSFIEMLIFIIIIGILAATAAIPFTTASKTSPKIKYQLQALALAQQRMSSIVGICHAEELLVNCAQQYEAKRSDPAFASFFYVPNGFTVNATFSSLQRAPYYPAEDNFYRVITVNVSGLASASLTSLVSSYGSINRYGERE